MSQFFEHLKRVLLVFAMSLNFALKRLNGQDIDEREYMYYEKLMFEADEMDKSKLQELQNRPDHTSPTRKTPVAA